MPNERFIDCQCWHCGKFTNARYLGHVLDRQVDQIPNSPPYEHGTEYELYECEECKKILVHSGHWDETMDSEDFSPSLIFPTEEHYHALRKHKQLDLDRQCMELAVAEARKCKSEPGKKSPYVGAVLVRGAKILGKAYRGECKAGEHAEYTLLYGKFDEEDLSDAVLYTTLEPCTRRNPPKLPCVEHILARKILRVVIGMLDPNDVIRGRGILMLREAGIHVELFPPDLMRSLEGLNHAFIRDQKARNPTDPGAGKTPSGGN